MTTHYEFAEAKAKALGAVSVSKEYYPKRPYHPDEVFAVRFFDANDHEVGYYIPDLQKFHPEGHLITFPEPREWDTMLMLQCLRDEMPI